MARRDTEFPTEEVIKWHARKDAMDGVDGESPIEKRMLDASRYHLTEAQAVHGATVAATVQVIERGIRAQPDETTIRSLLEPAFADVRRHLADRKLEISRAVAKEVRESREFQLFRQREKRATQTARYPSRHRTLYWFAPALLGFGIESTVNVALLGGHLSAGSVEALGLSTGVAFLNTSLAVSAAEACRFTGHRMLSRRLLSFFAIIILVALLLLVHLSYARFRTLVGLGPIGDVGSFLRDALAAPLDLNFPGLLLLVMGLGAAAAVAHRKFASDDPYPGFGAADRALRQAQEEGDAQRRSLLTIRAQALRRARGAIEDCLAEAVAGLEEMRKAIGRLQAAEVSYAAQRQAILERLHEGLWIYTVEYSKVLRTNLPARAHSFPDLGDLADPLSLDRYFSAYDSASANLSRMSAFGQQLIVGFDQWIETTCEGLLAKIEEDARALPVSGRAAPPFSGATILEGTR